MEDEKIVQLYLNRDDQAIAETSEKYGAYCTTIAKNILGNNEDAEECVNDTYLNAWNSIPPNQPKILSAFLGKITRNLSIDKYRKDHAEKRGKGEAALVLDELQDCVSDSLNVEDEIDKKELIKTIEKFLDTITPDKKKMFICRYWYFDSIPEIAKRFKVSENNVSVTLNRVRSKLKDYLNERGYAL